MPPSGRQDGSKITVLVVDDSPIDRALVTSLLEKQLAAAVELAEDGRAALGQIDHHPPDIVLTDLQMPKMDGLALVEAIRQFHPEVPAVVMTAHGSEDIALAALRQGAASYVNKRNLASRIAETVRDVLAVSQGHRQQLRVQGCWKTTSCEFELENDATLVPVLVNHLQQYQSSVRRCDENELLRIGVALHEAIRNAIHHGNLELSSELRQHNPESYYRMAEQRRFEQPYRDRRVRLRVRESPDESEYVVTDEGRGFDVCRFDYDPTTAMNRDKPSGRGLFLIRTFMDEVSFNSEGNQIRMFHRRSRCATRDCNVQAGSNHRSNLVEAGVLS